MATTFGTRIGEKERLVANDVDEKALQDIDWRETSGVDYGANLIDGWMVMKSRNDFDNAEALIKEADASLDSLLDLLEAIGGVDTTGSPQEVSAAIKTVTDWAQKEVGATPNGSPTVKTFLQRLLASLRVRKERVEQEMSEQEITALIQSWPSFVTKYVAAYRSDAPYIEKRAALGKALMELGDDIEQSVTKGGAAAAIGGGVGAAMSGGKRGGGSSRSGDNEDLIDLRTGKPVGVKDFLSVARSLIGGKDKHYGFREKRLGSYVRQPGDPDWDEDKHPRVPAGSEEGGQFTAKAKEEVEMAKCSKCGEEYPAEEGKCPKCGTDQDK